ncbi:LuxR family transcriptional regulator [Streptosporangium subroseum]|uniref:LuxR family transcriptional regulator n=1 Tax=Streptosporangium subroseum TaxID=106412 RepID=UPI00344706B3
MLHGRTSELRALDLLLTGARSSQGGALVIRGDIGAGRTALLDHAAESAAAAGMRVLRARALERERDLPFAGLSLLLPAALDAPDLGGDRLQAGLAMLELLHRAAAARPLVCLVDDAQWIDRHSAEALAFAARRLGDAPMALLFTVRSGPEDAPSPLSAEGLPELPLRPLGMVAAGLLLAETASDLPAHTRDRIRTAAEGNPLALLEFSATTRQDPAASMLKTITVWPETAERLLEQYDETPLATERMLLLCAADDTKDAVVLNAAARRLELHPSDLYPAERAGIVRLGRDGMTFTHPLLRPAIYQRSTIADRVAVHRALADSLGPERGARHLAAGATYPDAAIADLLDRSAVRLTDRAAATAAMEDSARLSTDPRARARRLAAAAAGAADLGLTTQAHRLAARAEALPRFPGVRGDLMAVRARMAGVRPSGPVEGLLLAGDDPGALALATALVTDARVRGMPGRLPYALLALSEARLHLGDHRLAATSAEEGLAAAREAGQPHIAHHLNAVLAWLAAVRGDLPEGDGLPERDGKGERRCGDDPTPLGVWAAGLLHLGLARAALSPERLLEGSPHLRAIPDLVEAAVRAGVPEAGHDHLARFERWAAGTGRPEPAGLAIRCRALLGGRDPERLYAAATRLLTARPYDHARTTLLHGEWLRRARRPAEARERLRVAHAVFEDLGARPWAERALAELRAAGEPVTGRKPPGLPPQQLRVIRLAAGGASNREIATRLGISPRTVGNHLYKAFPRLGVASRDELEGLLRTGHALLTDL